MTHTAEPQACGQRLTVGVLHALRGETGSVRTELTRIDAKASALIGWAGAAVAVVSAAATVATVPLLSKALTVGAAGLLVAAAGLLLAIIRPRVPRKGAVGFAAIAGARGAEEVLEQVPILIEDQCRQAAAELLLLSRIARDKYRRLRLAVDLLLAALLVLAAALAPAVTA
ncbi:Pycsar system effector family protein [Thermopolyspora sp. NPDC052614]|uniref:Pycsar system effector family protein n=1 Tax=Thermopolyspora sp. NPDC052614 TaxID=3155682 RepID=UPI003442EDAF